MAIKYRIWTKSVICFCLLFLLFTACSNDDDNPSGTKTLDRLNWSEQNYKSLNQLIDDYGIGGKYYSKDEAPYAVLDWDQTCAFLDVEEALFRYQLTNFRFKLSKEQFSVLLKDEINGVKQLPSDFHSILLSDINKDLVEEYSFIYDRISGPDATMTLQKIKSLPQYQDFRAKLPYLYDAYCATDSIGSDYGYPWVICLLAGHTLDEVKTLAKEAIAFELANGLFKQEWSSPTLYQSHAGSVSYSFKTGLRVLPEMQNLIETFTKQGIDVFIVSASFKPVVETFAAPGNFGYHVPAENVIGMELALSANGNILPEYKQGWVKTFRQGKVEAINRVIKQHAGKTLDPLFAAGDSDGDYEMLTCFPGMKLALIWNRLKGGDIGKLCKQAVDESNNENPRVILQGRNENTGLAIPSSSTIPFGKTEARLLP